MNATEPLQPGHADHGAGWLQISTEGFSSFNKSRPQGHLVKELVQNSFDAIGEGGGTVDLGYHHDGSAFHVSCCDSGAGIEDLAAMRVVYLTFKVDSHLKRGRFGRGFKEILSVAKSATVSSGGGQIQFVTENGRQVTRVVSKPDAQRGTAVEMMFDWPPETIGEFDSYFSRFLVPDGVTFRLNGRTLPPRPVRFLIAAQLPTEIYHAERHSWQKPRRKTTIELVETRDGETPHIYEMGIPVAETEWTVPFHANIQQRVPMNPNRDALASGYARRIHTACLPTIVALLDAQELTADWIGAAGVEAEPEVQKAIVEQAFGPNAVRSVPAMGKRDFDDDAERNGASIVKTAQMSSGFREMAKAHLPTAREAVVKREVEIAEEIASTRFQVEDVEDRTDPRLVWIEKRGGSARINRRLSFAVWFCQKLVDSTNETHMPVTGAVALGERPALGKSPFLAHWTNDNRLTLALEFDPFWDHPLGAKALSVLIHEAAHARNMHHGKGFHDEVERLGGVAAEVMFHHGDEVRRGWADLMELSPNREGDNQAG